MDIHSTKFIKDLNLEFFLWCYTFAYDIYGVGPLQVTQIESWWALCDPRILISGLVTN